MNDGKQALARLLEQLAGSAERINAGESSAAIAEAVWPTFRAALLGVLEEVDTEHVDGLRRWQQARHPET
jgi:hypothetical protein